MTRLQFLLASLLASVASFFPTKKLREYPYIHYSTRIYALTTKDGKWQWRTFSGIEMSPVFDSKQSALAHVAKGQYVQFIRA